MKNFYADFNAIFVMCYTLANVYDPCFFRVSTKKKLLSLMLSRYRKSSDGRTWDDVVSRGGGDGSATVAVTP